MLVWTILLAPLVASAIILLVTIRSKTASVAVALTGAVASFLAACLVFAGGDDAVQPLTWLSVAGGLSFDIAPVVDRLSRAMLLVVTGIGLLVMIFSLGYMKDDEGRARYFGGLCFFLFSMLGIVLSGNLVMMFLFWELVGFSSYLLIGHWYRKPAAADAAKKAFIVNRVGDFGFMLGILMVWAATGAFDFDRLREAAAGYATGDALLTAGVLLIFCGAVGKSAQFPLHVWLPDAMEGPTPVSALIHAATMVAAGVYMMVRVDFLVAASPVAQTVIASVGAITLLLAALMATQQDDIKKILAYSTVSQLGYMIMAIGVVASSAAMFHLITHAFFKALLFLGSGSVIAAMHHEQNIWKMGGLKNKLPITFLTFAIATLALTGFPGLSGFFSKDAILAEAYEFKPGFFWIAWFAAILTAFYMTRLFLVVFLGKPLSEEAKHAAESPASMTVPLVVLAVPSILAGYPFFIGWLYEKPPHPHHLPGWFLPVAISAFFLGAALAFTLYRKATKDPILIPLFKNKFHFDTLYDWYVSRIQAGIATAMAWVDKWVLDSLLVRGLAGLAWATGYLLRFFQIGNLQAYSILFGLGIIALFYFALFR